MNDYSTSGRWTVSAENQDAFLDAWAAFAAWGSTTPGAGPLRLARDLDDPELFISYGEWDSYEAIRSWKDTPVFRERIAQVLQYVSKFESKNLNVMLTVENGSSTTHADLSRA
jgi:heme-degrading monooxygenase HmoA